MISKAAFTYPHFQSLRIRLEETENLTCECFRLFEVAFEEEKRKGNFLEHGICWESIRHSLTVSAGENLWAFHFTGSRGRGRGGGAGMSTGEKGPREVLDISMEGRK